ncbi:MAG: MmgE/PrpD family protein [Firmicutes bacterium]|nr:MmgE/PrpD family protein [Bacillota bacterium]
MAAIAGWAERMAALRAGALSPAERGRLGVHLYDTVCAMALGAKAPEGRALGAAHRRFGRSGPAAEAGILAAWARLTEVDDIAMEATVTPGALAASAVLPFAARGEGEDYAGALWVGYETAVRWGKYFDGAAILYRGIWPTYLVAPAAVAAAVGRLRNLSAEKMAHALAIALSLSSGVAGRIVETPSSRWLTLALAVECGVKAALAAESGFRGDLQLLEATVWERLGGGIRAGALEDGPPAFLEVSLKSYAAAKQTMAAVEAFTRLWVRRRWPAESIRVEVPSAYAQMIAGTPGARRSALTSVAYLLGLVATDPERLYDVARTGEELGEIGLAVANKVEVAAAPDLAGDFPRHWPGRVVLTGPGGTDQETVTITRGDPEDPLDLEAVRTKYERCARYHCPVVSPLQAAACASLEPTAIRAAGRQMLDALTAGPS